MKVGKGDVPSVFFFKINSKNYTKDKTTSGDISIFVIAQRLVPISLTLAPIGYTSSSTIKKRSWDLWGNCTNTKAHFIAFHLIFTFRVQSNKISMNQRNIIQNKITWNIKKFYSNRLIIWRSQVQALAGPHFYYSDLRAFVGRCFSFLRKQCVNKLFELGIFTLWYSLKLPIIQ